MKTKQQFGILFDTEDNEMSAVIRSRVITVIETESIMPIGWGNGAGKLIREYYTLEGNFIARADVEIEED